MNNISPQEIDTSTKDSDSLLLSKLNSLEKQVDELWAAIVSLQDAVNKVHGELIKHRRHR